MAAASLLQASGRQSFADALFVASLHQMVRLRFSAMLVGGEAKEAFTAFFEKRKPDFSKFD